MSWDAIICDWNGTIIEDRDEKPILESIAVDVFKASVPWHPARMARILKARRRLQALYKEKQRDAEFDFVIEMFRVYNDGVVRGLPVSLIHRAVQTYARKPETQAKLDHRLLRSVARCRQLVKLTGILSAGYEYGIKSILTAAGYANCFDFVEANQLREYSGKAFGFQLDIYTNKRQALLNLLSNMGLDANRVVYLGDSDGDAGCFQLVGRPVVAFLCPDDLKQKYAQSYAAFVPRDEADLMAYLTSS
ncbi:MAG: hypothetical protein DRI40_08320 [Chloroflexi bacterium]|nr:MAG: hypothetical protein DRI40_08320 [Chloroflexota bacterium]